jgi:hypothetical protein
VTMARNAERNQMLFNRWFNMLEEMKQGGPKGCVRARRSRL